MANVKVAIHRHRLLGTVSRLALDVLLFVGGWRMGLIKTIGRGVIGVGKGKGKGGRKC